ncbi:MAG: hypothetical protein ACSLE0_17630 [Chitinophagaceae bacterium]
MTKEEIADELNQLIFSDSYILFDRTFFNSEVPVPISTIEELSETDRITIWINNNKFAPKCSSKGAGKMTGKFLFDYYKDPVIEFDLGKITSNLVSPSRLFYKTGWVDDKELREIHIKSANRIVRTFKKKLITTQRLKPFYISHSIISLLNKNYELELGEGGTRVTKLTLNGT